jgi:hypothetical protein
MPVYPQGASIHTDTGQWVGTRRAVTMPHTNVVGPRAAHRPGLALAAGRVGRGGVTVVAPHVVAQLWIGVVR